MREGTWKFTCTLPCVVRELIELLHEALQGYCGKVHANLLVFNIRLD